MGFFNRKPKAEAIPYDPATQQPAVRKSICTGEMTLGFVDRRTGKFSDYMLAPDQSALEAFCRGTGVEAGEIKVVY